MSSEVKAHVQAALAANPGLGVASAVAAFHAVLALGTSSGAALVLLPRGLQPDGQPSKCAAVCSHHPSQGVRGHVGRTACAAPARAHVKHAAYRQRGPGGLNVHGRRLLACPLLLLPLLSTVTT